MTKRINPYTRLKNLGSEYICELKNPETVGMWTYPKSRLDEGWSLTDLYERIKAAEQLGYDVKLMATNKGIEANYVKQAKATPWEFRY